MTNTVEDRVNQLFRRLIEGKLQTAGPRLESGWEMSLPSGETVVRSTLQAEAQAAIELATEAIPYLVPYVRNENLAIRYVAIYALEQITGEKSAVPYFSPPGADAKIEQAIQTWLSWYHRRQAAE